MEVLLHRTSRAAGAALLTLALTGTAHAAGLGAIQVRSALGEPLRVAVKLLDKNAVPEAGCVNARIASLDGMLAIQPLVRLDQAGTILLSTTEALNEPVLHITVEVACGNSIRREYQVLLDPAAPTPMPALAVQSATATPQAAEKTKAKSKRKEHHAAAEMRNNSPAPRSILKMSRDLGQDSKPLAVTRLESPEVQTTVIQERDDRSAEMLALIQAMHEETRAMRAETARMQQQSARDREEIAALRQDSQFWIRGLLALLMLCAFAVTGLLWRLYTMKRNAARVSWNELFSDTTSTTQGPQTEFTTTAFQITAIDTGALEEQTTNTPSPEGVASSSARPAAKADTPREEAFRYDSGSTIPYVFSNQVEHVNTRAAAAPTAAPEQALQAEEIADVMELAETWMAMRDPVAVEKLLEPFGKADEPQSPLPLLCLLDVYRELDKRDKFDVIRKRIKTLFNVNPASWEADTETPARTLAAYPHVREQVLASWESGEAAGYLHSLVADDRHGLREGFDLPAYRDILRLKDIAERRVPHARSHLAMEADAYAILFTEEHRDTPAPDPVIEMEEKQEAAAKPGFAMRDDMSPMAIKLHLAVAYKDIGDREGAVLLLEEVIQGGNDEQRAQARQQIAALVAAEAALLETAG